MPITKITTDDLRRMENKEGLILQGCGGNLYDWLEGINNTFEKAGILENGTRFRDAYVFEHDGLTNLLFPFEDVKLDGGKLALWRIQRFETFGGTWLSDYVPNRLGGFETQAQKPKCALIGEDGNIFNLMGIAARTLRQAGQPEQAREMLNRITQCQSYDSALGIIGEYVEITDREDMEMSEEMDGMHL